ncbi:MAG: octaprenyl diphosphate synthase [Xanthomonadales bacterium]|nr:octaprenyl diphosphate synthase [Xanthomonadales bacterium]
MVPGEDVLAAPMAEVDACIRRNLTSDVVLVNQIADYIIGGGGKRLRPKIHLLAAGACGYQGDKHIELAAIIEFIHTATLLHDDVVDESEQRRGRGTANSVWGNAAAVLVGDFLYSRSFQMMVHVDSMRVMEILSETTNTIAEGEVMQLMQMGNPETDERRYLQVIQSKTATLFEAATQLGGVLADVDLEVEMALARYGRHLGTAFQLADDLLDYDGDSAQLGKNVGDDLAEGKPTLPLIHAMAVGNKTQRAIVTDAITNGGLQQLDPVISAIQDTKSLDYTRSRAEEEAANARFALTALPDSRYRNALESLATFAVRRDR